MSKVLITGASSGIGKELAKNFAQKSYHLILLARRKKSLEELQKNLTEKYPITCEIICYDLSSPVGLESIVQNYDFDILINCAGFGKITSFDRVSPTKEQEMLQVNLLSPILLTRFFLKKALPKGKGTVINICSTAAFYYHPYMAAYSTSKVALLQYSLSIQEELRKEEKNITVISICPGPTNTDFFPEATKQKFGIFQSWNMSSEEVAKEIIKTFEQKKIFRIVGLRNSFLVHCIRCLPTCLQLKFVSAHLQKIAK